MEKRETIQVKDFFNRRRSSYLSVNSIEERRESIESLYNSILNVSVSLSDDSSIADSNEIEKIQTKNKQLLENLTGRLTAFLFFNEVNCQIHEESSNSSTSTINELRNSIEDSLNHINSNQHKFEIKALIENISKLKFSFEKEIQKLEDLKSEMAKLEEEETNLNKKLENFEMNTKMLLEDKNSQKNNACACVFF